MHEATRRKPSQTARTVRIVSLTLIVVAVALGTGILHRASTRATWPTAIPASNTALQVETLHPLTATETCQDAFLAHPLTHVTRAKGEVVTYYDSNGSGIAADDLDGDGDLDLVLANLNGPNIVAWNEGDFTFREQPLTFGGSRAVAIVDLDGDGGRDLTFTQGFGAILAYRDDGSPVSDVSRYQRVNLRGVDQPAYAMDWMDVDLDGDLDLLTASYDTMLAKDRRDGFLFGRQGGVTLYLAEGDAYQPVRLSDRAQALAVALHDVTGDGWPDVIVGNDFEVPDDVFVNPGASGGDWIRGNPFPLTTRNTMGFDVADVNADGRLDLFATDMKPSFQEAREVVSWLPLLDDGYHAIRQSEDQIPENVLLQARADGTYRNVAYPLGIDATGWSWSGRFGDLNLDGRLDLYVVNGMIAREAFPHLPGHALIESNHAFRATASGFDPAPEWNLAATGSGRGMTLADLDGDGDLDVAVNNLQSASVVYENRACRDGAPWTLELSWPETRNPRAVGATVTLASGDARYTRTVRATAGYLSGADPHLHFGLPAHAPIDAAWITWPDGQVTRLTGIEVGTHARATRLDAPRLAQATTPMERSP